MALSDNLNDLVSVIIRSVGERTESLCKELVLEQGILEGNISVIRKTPFTRAIEASYEAGIALNLPWTLCLDADVLLHPGSISELLTLAEEMDPLFFEIQGLILDKFFGGLRTAGNHLYRTSLLDQALECIPTEQNIIQPEWHTLEVMKNRGFSWKRVNYLVGIHDFEQYYKDIFRKCFIYSHKHLGYAELLLTHWLQQARSDSDYKIALEGFIRGFIYEGNIHIDAKQEIYNGVFKTLQVIEKPDLQPGFFNISEVENLINNWVSPPVYHKYFPPKRMSRKEKLIEKSRTLGVFKLPIFLFGYSLEKVGGIIKRMVNSQNAYDH